MNDGEERMWCYFHPREMVIGVCAQCLNERLLDLAAKQAQIQTHKAYNFAPKRVLPKLFPLTNLFNRLDIKHSKSHEVYTSSASSQEDSFISIKFEDNGVASWDKGDQKCEMSSTESWDNAKKIKTVIEHAKPRATVSWQRPIGHLFHLIKWKKSNKDNVCHVDTKLEGANFNYGWIRSTLAKRWTKE